jgi:acyl-coenzyme A thioesterase PaaI-like protein
MKPSVRPPNRMQRQLQRLDRLPGLVRPVLRSAVLRRAVPFTGTAGIDFVALSPERVEVRLPSVRKVHNHIGGIHASAMNLLAETATGMVVGMNVRDDCVPVAKEMRMAFRKRASGSMRAVATLSDAQARWMQSQDKGEVTVPVTVTDDTGAEPVECMFTWAWIPAGPRKN